MVSQSQFFRDFYLFSLMRFPLCWKNVRNFKQNFAQKEGTRCKYFIMQLPCKNRQVYLHRLFSKALEAAHLRIFLMAHFSLGSAIAALYLNGREPMRLWQAAHRLVRRIQEHPAANLA